MSIGAKYFGFDYEIVEEDLMEQILDDTEKGGIFGFSADDRTGFYNSYCKKRSEWSKLRYNIFSFLNDETSIFKKIFPSRAKMAKLGYEDKLLFISWIKRFYSILTKKRVATVEEKRSGIESRMELMKKLDMIK